ncbi:MAG TPA: lamin tail domain-containing protein [Verrucomicrobiales bacterium]|nr:lamin tail domain-containing protein [Verrucomicrobiales bacterium]
MTLRLIRSLAIAAFGSLSFAAPSRAAISLANGSFESVEGTTLIPPAPQYDIFKPVSWDILTVGTPWDAGSSSVTGGTGNFDAIASGSITGSRYLRLASDSADNGSGAVAQNLGTMVAGEVYTIKADAFGGNGNIGWTAKMELRSNGANSGGTVYASDAAGPQAQDAFTADDFTVSYTATPADQGNPLWLRIAVDPSTAPNTAMRGGVDNVRLTVALSTPDTTAPVLVSAVSPYAQQLVILTFDEPVDLTGASFTIPGGTVTNAAQGATPGTVLLTVTGLTAGSDYSVTANNVKDAAGNVRPASTVAFTAAPPPGPAPIELVRPGREPIGPASRRGGIVISEINYHPADRADSANLEFIEICNTLPWTEDLSGFRLSGEVNFAFPAGTTIPADGYRVVAAAPASVQSVYSITGVLGPWTGALNNSGGMVRLRDFADAVIFEVNYDSGPPWQPAADGAGHSLILARPSYGMDNPKSWDFSYNPGGSPGAADPFPADPWRTIMINEIRATASFPGDFIELYNYSHAAVDLSGCSLSDDRNEAKYVFPASSSIAPEGFVAVQADALGFGLKAGGDTVYFRAPGTGGAPGRVLDALRFGPQQSGTTYGRYPDGAASFSTLDEDSAGMPNDPPFAKEAVISEILYHPPVGSSQPPFVEIANISGAALNLGGWRLRGGVSYNIPPGTTLSAGGHLAITAFSGSLNQGTGERIRLEKPVENMDGAVTEMIYPVIDEFTYSTGGHWGRDSDGSGSSLERKDLRSDGRFASNWTDSDESGESSWITMTNTGILDNGLAGAPPNRLEIMLLGAGEALIDNVEFVQGAGANIVSNPGFENGMSGWLAGGTHQTSSVEPGKGVGGTAALHLRASGRGDTANRIITVLTSTAATGTTRTLRAQVKYLRGYPEILFRIRGGWLETTGNLLTGVIPGTPGAPNSRAAANAGPAISAVTHLPVLPQAGQDAVVYAAINDPDGIGAAVLNYRIDPSIAPVPMPMLPRGAGIYSATIPAQTAGKLAAFHITATDGAGASSIFPADAPASECLIRWGETQPANNTLTTYRLWLTQATNNTWTTRMRNSNHPLDSTFVCGDYRVIYNAGAMYSGSPNHTPGYNGPAGSAACDYNVVVPSDDRFLGETDMLWVGPGSQGTDNTWLREQGAWWITRKLGLPATHLRYINLNVNGSRRGQVMLDSQQPNGTMMAEYFPDDDDGALHKCQDWIEYDDSGTSFTGTTITRAILAPAKSAGQHKISAYRYRWAIRSAENSVNDFSALTSLIDAFNTGSSATDPAFFNTLDPILDQDSWSRALAIQRIVGNWDSWGWSYGKNMYIYKPRRGQWTMMPWDMDIILGPDGSQAINPPPDVATAPLFTNTSSYDANSPGDPLATKFRSQPGFRRAYWRALLEAANDTMVPATFNARMDLFAAGLVANTITPNATQLAQVKTYVSNRRNYILSQANAVFGTTSFALTGSNNLSDPDGVLTLTGTAPPAVGSLRINGVLYHPLWTGETAWSLPLTLYASANNLTVEALDIRGGVLGSFPVTINVTGPPPLPPVTINEWMPDNSGASGIVDPADGGSEDWFELHNHGAAPVDLGGFFLTDTAPVKNQFVIPAGTAIPAGGYLLVWADDEPEQNGITAGQLHAGFKLNAGGEQIGLYTPDGTAVDLITFTARSADQSEGRYPDSAAQITFPVPTPGKRNALAPEILNVTPAGTDAMRISISSEPGYSYQIENSTDLVSWTPWNAPVAASMASFDADLPRSGPFRFWRARMLLTP